MSGEKDRYEPSGGGLEVQTDTGVCRCSHGFSCHVCDGCRDHHEPGCLEAYRCFEFDGAQIHGDPDMQPEAKSALLAIIAAGKDRFRSENSGVGCQTTRYGPGCGHPVNDHDGTGDCCCCNWKQNDPDHGQICLRCRPIIRAYLLRQYGSEAALPDGWR